MSSLLQITQWQTIPSLLQITHTTMANYTKPAVDYTDDNGKIYQACCRLHNGKLYQACCRLHRQQWQNISSLLQITQWQTTPSLMQITQTTTANYTKPAADYTEDNGKLHQACCRLHRLQWQTIPSLLQCWLTGIIGGCWRLCSAECVEKMILDKKLKYQFIREQTTFPPLPSTAHVTNTGWNTQSHITWFYCMNKSTMLPARLKPAVTKIKHTVVMPLTFILIIISIPAPSLFHSRLKTFFSANPSHRSLPFLLQDRSTHSTDSPDCLLILLSIPVFYFLVLGSVR